MSSSTVVQGLGGGGLISIPNIIISDLVPLHERGAFQAILGLYVAFLPATVHVQSQANFSLERGRSHPLSVLSSAAHCPNLGSGAGSSVSPIYVFVPCSAIKSYYEQT